jgi:hypothetical protein
MVAAPATARVPVLATPVVETCNAELFPAPSDTALSVPLMVVLSSVLRMDV